MSARERIKNLFTIFKKKEKIIYKKQQKKHVQFCEVLTKEREREKSDRILEFDNRTMRERGREKLTKLGGRKKLER